MSMASYMCNVLVPCVTGQEERRLVAAVLLVNVGSVLQQIQHHILQDTTTVSHDVT